MIIFFKKKKNHYRYCQTRATPPLTQIRYALTVRMLVQSTHPSLQLTTATAAAAAVVSQEIITMETVTMVTTEEF